MSIVSANWLVMGDPWRVHKILFAWTGHSNLVGTVQDTTDPGLKAPPHTVSKFDCENDNDAFNSKPCFSELAPPPYTLVRLLVSAFLLGGIQWLTITGFRTLNHLQTIRAAPEQKFKFA